MKWGTAMKLIYIAFFVKGAERTFDEANILYLLMAFFDQFYCLVVDPHEGRWKYWSRINSCAVFLRYLSLTEITLGKLDDILYHMLNLITQPCSNLKSMDV